MAATSAEKAKLLKQIRQRDADIEALRDEAQRLRTQQHSFHDEFEQRVKTLEAKLLRSHLVPVVHTREISDEQAELDIKELEHEFARQRLLKLTDFPPDGPKEEEEDALHERLELEEIQQSLGLPPPPMLPPGAEVVDVRVHSLSPGTLEEWREEQRLARRAMKLEMLPHEVPQRPPPPVLAGRVIPSNAMLTPSPYHPVGPLTDMGFYQNVYPITRPPVSVDNVLATSWAGAAEPSYQAYADFFEARHFPQIATCEVEIARNPVKGGSGPAQFWADMAGMEYRRGTHCEKTYWTQPPPPQPWQLPPWRIPRAERAVVNTCAMFFPA